jgi:hypothetical protein
MAFDRPDTDALYDRVIVPTLEAVNLRAVRVDRVEHNGDIDDRIIQELNESRLVLADLTFARPSVYFEAGYAQRKVPVIYTCRKDHFGGTSDTARVHFDLQMRNIIGWSRPDDPTFKQRLTKRLRHVLRPILQEEQEIAQFGAQEAYFRTLSVNDQRKAMKQLLQDEIKKAGFKRFEIPANDNGFYTTSEDELRFLVRYGFKLSDSSLTIVEGVVPDGGAIKSLAHAAHYESPLQDAWFERNKKKKQMFYSRHILFCTSESVSRQSLLRSLTNFTFNSEQECFSGSLFGLKMLRYGGPLPVNVHILDKVKSLEGLRILVRQKLAAISEQKLHQVVKSKALR